MNSSAAPVARPDEAAVLSEPKIQENDPAERKERKLQIKMNGSAAMASGPDEAVVLSEPKIQENHRKEQKPERSEGLTSDAKLAANRANAQLSTGPATSEGKAKSSLNAVKTGLTGRTVVLPSDDAAIYENHIRGYFNELKPVGLRESGLAQSLADTAWRLERIRSIEMAIYAQGHIQFADLFDTEDPAIRRRLIDLHTHLTYEKQLRNLQLQESRLRRHREKDSAELHQLQQERIGQEKEDLDTPAQFGFDFSSGNIETNGGVGQAIAVRGLPGSLWPEPRFTLELPPQIS